MCDYKELKDDIYTKIIRLIDSQTHSSELGDPYRHMRQLIEELYEKETK